MKVPKGQPIAPPMKFSINADFQKEFTFKQRLQLFLGYTLIINVSVACQHNPGQFVPVLDVKPVKEKREKNKNL